MTSFNERLQQVLKEQTIYFERGETHEVSFRLEMLTRLYESVNTYEEALTEALYQDLGKSAAESYMTEIGIVLSSIRYVKKHLTEWTKKETVETPLYLQPAKSYVQRMPYGVSLIVGPFNYPVQLVLEPLIGSIAGGNCTVIKPSEYTPHTNKVLKEMLMQIYPLQYVAILEGEKEETDALFRAPFDKIFFTGSVNVGKIAMKRAAERLTPITLELGGKSPVIVDETAKLKVAAERISWGKFTNNGQTCVAPDYVYVHASVYDRFIEQLKRTITRFYGKYPLESPDYGRIIHEKHWDRLDELMKKEHLSIVFGGHRNREKKFIAPTIFALEEAAGPLMEDELFGPLLPVIPYTNFREVIHAIDRGPRPLAGYIFTEDETKAAYFMTYARFGGGCVNDTLAHVGNIHLPFGGVASSGHGTYHGKASFDAFTHEKGWMEKNTDLNTPFAYPPHRGKKAILRTFLK